MPKKQAHNMVLRRLGQSLREQDWFAAGIEFFIVIVGVFLGLQAANWNEERLAREDERAIIERLHEETGNLLEAVRAEGAGLQSHADDLVSAQPMLFSAEPERALTQDECLAILSSHVYRKPLDELPILDELLSTGRFDRLQNSDLKQLLRAYIQFRDRERGTHEERTNELFRLYSRYPDLVRVGVTAIGNEQGASGRFELLSANDYRWNQSCDARAMRQSQPFLNDLFDNMARSGNVLIANKKRETMLIQLSERLSDLLNS
ncbi:hypothetical protein GRI43_03605 [Altererythrobacter luteolus]|uniref:Uncharacterized protein n=1 Tax=Pontixanthobacter luteolus TaxID=295089 RepID=A0A6I4V0X7_9SPHN|nr:hypothetical protein [Pontixanthobacter luteolus]MXP46480.1 hypothetical protein [Pontixanthobacter luteolus]